MMRFILIPTLILTAQIASAQVIEKGPELNKATAFSLASKPGNSDASTESAADKASQTGNGTTDEIRRPLRERGDIAESNGGKTPEKSEYDSSAWTPEAAGGKAGFNIIGSKKICWLPFRRAFYS